jgi:hypothetical protein
VDNRQSDGGCPLTHSPYYDDDGEGGVSIIPVGLFSMIKGARFR